MADTKTNPKNAASPKGDAQKSATALEKKSESAVAAKAGPIDPKAGKKPKKKKGGVIFALLLIVLIGAAVAMYMMNLLNFKTYVVNYFITQDEQYQQIMTKNNQLAEQLNKEIAALDARTKELDGREETITSKEASIEKQQAKLKEDKASLDADRTAYDEGLTERAQVVSIISNLDASKAAKMLEEYRSLDEVARILSELTPAKASAIIEKFSAAVAAQVTEQMLYMSQSD
jgi:flagellar motility protein MotE (MotC chaperone)